MRASYFSEDTFAFLSALAGNNNRAWFEANRDRYEDTVRTPALRFIGDAAPVLAEISPHFRAIPKKVGGSLMRVFRDTRFSADKTPYKTNIGIQFRHEWGKDVHAPGYYLHVAPDGCFVGVGIWRPDGTALGRIRDAIVENPRSWKAVRDDRKFRRRLRMDGERLSRPPQGFAKDHPLIEDLKRKDFIATGDLDPGDVTAKDMLDRVMADFRLGAPLMAFLCDALELRY